MLGQKRLGHVCVHDVKKSILEEAILGIPFLHLEESTVCGDCQGDHVLEFLQMDLMGPMYVESLGGK